MENKSPEKKELQTNISGETITFTQKMETMSNDPKVKEGVVAFVRTILNVGISIADAAPGGVGEILDAVALIGKKIREKNKDKSQTGGFDLTPDVPAWVNVLANAGEIPTGGVFPSYAIPTVFQLSRDIPRMVEGFNQARSILKNEQVDYQVNKTQIDNAIEKFNPKK
ncbi:MAG: hypothetical protein PHR98_03255 [Candidatus Shapirobacteria bacterium]|jgi:hypothetical protein|nr:hypothetical protein [Candidatus Shapirobacteria bacterium]MDD3999088.1 hypothetical protein [Candidatus Shapirobacteria bacterium]